MLVYLTTFSITKMILRDTTSWEVTIECCKMWKQPTLIHFIVILWYFQSFIYSPTDALVSYLRNNIKISTQIYIKTAPTCFGVITSSSGSVLIRAY